MSELETTPIKPYTKFPHEGSFVFVSCDRWSFTVQEYHVKSRCRVLRNMLDTAPHTVPRPYQLDVPAKIAKLFVQAIVGIANEETHFGFRDIQPAFRLCREYGVDMRAVGPSILAGCGNGIRSEDAFEAFAIACDMDDRVGAAKVLRGHSRWTGQHPLLPIRNWGRERTRLISSIWVKDLMEVTKAMGPLTPEQIIDRLVWEDFAHKFFLMSLQPTNFFAIPSSTGYASD